MALAELAILEKTYPNAVTALEYRSEFELLVAVILSAQCTDARVNMTTPALFAKYPTPEKLARARPESVEKIIKSPHPSDPEKAQIAVEGADELYKEIRIANHLTDENGDQVRLKQGAKVEVTVEAGPEAVTPSPEN